MSIFTQADVARFRSDRLLALLNTYAPELAPDDTYLLGKLQAAEADIAHQLRVFLEPTKVFPYEPSSDEIAALGGTPWIEDPANDYDPEFFQGDKWGWLQTRRTPIVSVESIKIVYPQPSTSLYQIPDAWIKPDKRAGVIRLLPTAGAFTAPLAAFLMQMLGGGIVIPNVIQISYTAGLQNVRSDPRWADLVDVVYKKASLLTVEDLFLPSGGSVSGDGLSQSISVKMQDYTDMIDRKLFGPKGANGGLWTVIHGIVMGALGTSA